MSRKNRMSRLIWGAAALIAAALVASPVLLVAVADAKAPHGSPAEVILEPDNLTGDPTHAIHRGWWGHGTGASPTKTGSTFLSLDLANAEGKVTQASTAAIGKLLGDKTLANLRVAFVPYSADGSNERPAIRRGENAGEAFKWFTDYSFGVALNGAASKNDSVITVSTLNEWTAWWKLGRPLEGYLPNLSVVTIETNGTTRPAVSPEGASILNRWPAGEKISMVFYLSNGYDHAYPLIPTVASGADGRAISAWLTFRTVASPTDPNRTSAGFDVLTYSPPSAYPKAGKAPVASAATSSGPNASGAMRSSGAGAPRATTNDHGNWLVNAVPGGKPVLFPILALLAGGVLLGAKRWRSSVQASCEESPTSGDIPAASPAGEGH